MEEFVKEMGFESLDEFNKLVAAVDISDNKKMKSFIDWKENDGSKEGLMILFTNHN